MATALVCQLQNILNKYENEEKCYPQINKPVVTCCMTTPPPILLPTVPQPVKPLQLPCFEGISKFKEIEMSEEEALNTRYANFYNNYNIDWRAKRYSERKGQYSDPRALERCRGVTTDGKNPCCPKPPCKNKIIKDENKGCPTGFKPCQMKLTPPSNNYPCGVWIAEVQACPPKKKNKTNILLGPCCTRPCCKHWKPKDGDCKYDDPCKAHCFNHPPGMKPKNRY